MESTTGVGDTDRVHAILVTVEETLTRCGGRLASVDQEQSWSIDDRVALRAILEADGDFDVIRDDVLSVTLARLASCSMDELQELVPMRRRDDSTRRRRAALRRLRARARLILDARRGGGASFEDAVRASGDRDRVEARLAGIVGNDPDALRRIDVHRRSMNGRPDGPEARLWRFAMRVAPDDADLRRRLEARRRELLPFVAGPFSVCGTIPRCDTCAIGDRGLCATVLPRRVRTATEAAPTDETDPLVLRRERLRGECLLRRSRSGIEVLETRWDEIKAQVPPSSWRERADWFRARLRPAMIELAEKLAEHERRVERGIVAFEQSYAGEPGSSPRWEAAWAILSKIRRLESEQRSLLARRGMPERSRGQGPAGGFDTSRIA